MNKYTPGNTQTRKNGNKFTAAIITIIICIILSSLAVGYAMMNPKSDFDLIPNLKKPGKIHYSDMEYKRPNTKNTIENIDSLIQKIDDEEPFMDQSKLFNAIDNEMTNINTMKTLAEIRYYSDKSDAFYKAEYEFFSKEYINVSNKIAKLLDTIAASKFKTNYERTYFGAEYFTDWENLELSKTAKNLLVKEADLIIKYNNAFENPFITFNGKDIYHSSKEFFELSKEDQKNYLNRYYEKYHSILAPIYVDLVKVRLQFAEETEQDYIEYAYGAFNRDYTYEQANKYLKDINSEIIIPLMRSMEIDKSTLNKPMDTMNMFYYLSTAANAMGGKVSEAFEYMVEYGLYDIAYSENKVNISFETYLEKFNSPFVFVSPKRVTSDFLTFSHEFGHFVDAYFNLNEGITVDNTEIASQAMAYLAPLYVKNINGIDKDEFLKMNIKNTIDMYVSTYFTNAFETSAYSMKAEDVTLEALEKIAYNVAKEMKLSDESAKMLSKSWFEIQHIYSAPMYTVSYMVSNDIALQILEKELDSNKGVQAFENVISRNQGSSFIKDLTESGFVSPFEEGRAKDIAALFTDIYEKEPSAKSEEDDNEIEQKAA